MDKANSLIHVREASPSTQLLKSQRIVGSAVQTHNLRHASAAVVPERLRQLAAAAAQIQPAFAGTRRQPGTRVGQ